MAIVNHKIFCLVISALIVASCFIISIAHTTFEITNSIGVVGLMMLTIVFICCLSYLLIHIVEYVCEWQDNQKHNKQYEKIKYESIESNIKEIQRQIEKMNKNIKHHDSDITNVMQYVADMKKGE